MKWFYSVTTCLISFMMVPISNFAPTENKSVHVSVSWFSCIKIWPLPYLHGNLLTHVDVQSQIFLDLEN